MAKIKKIEYCVLVYERDRLQIWHDAIQYSFSTLRKKNAKRGSRYGKRK
jgi:hypothetical protein